MISRRFVVVLVLLSCAAGCDDWALVRSGPDATIPPCLTDGPRSVASDKVDLLIVMDNSGSMAEEQAAFARRLPVFLQDLLAPVDPPACPVSSLNVGVVSTDMGALGSVVSTCGGGPMGFAAGDDGCFRNTPSPATSGCDAVYPSFLSFDRFVTEGYSVDRLVQDLACIATLGTNGCGWQQQLEAARRALVDQTALGACNSGFLRPDSLVVILWVTVDDDMSLDPAHPEALDPERTDLGHLGDVRILLHPEFLVPLESYVAAFRGLSPSDRPRTLLGFVVGVPPDLAVCTGRGDELGACLGQSEMQQVLDPSGGASFAPSCNTVMGIAKPPRRFVQLAQEWGDAAYVGSICTADWTPAMEGLLAMIRERVESWTCWPALPFDAATCFVPEWYLVETLPDDRPCAEDPACPSAWCPSATSADLRNGTLPPCADPSGGARCEPLERDLGTVTLYSGSIRRQCLLRQAARAFDSASGRCGPPAQDGWYYVPSEWSAHGCAEILFRPTSGLIEVGARAGVECERL